jgi:hypothetical protein
VLPSFVQQWFGAASFELAIRPCVSSGAAPADQVAYRIAEHGRMHRIRDERLEVQLDSDQCRDERHAPPQRRGRVAERQDMRQEQGPGGVEPQPPPTRPSPS